MSRSGTVGKVINSSMSAAAAAPRREGLEIGEGGAVCPSSTTTGATPFRGRLGEPAARGAVSLPETELRRGRRVVGFGAHGELPVRAAGDQHRVSGEHRP